MDIDNLTPPQLPLLKTGKAFLGALKQSARVPTIMSLEALVDALDEYDSLRREYVRAVANFLEFRQALAADPDPGMAALGPERILTLRDTLLQASAAYPLIGVSLDEWCQQWCGGEDLVTELRSTFRGGLEAISLVLAQVHGNRVLTASWAQLEQAFAQLYICNET